MSSWWVGASMSVDVSCEEPSTWHLVITWMQESVLACLGVGTSSVMGSSFWMSVAGWLSLLYLTVTVGLSSQPRKESAACPDLFQVRPSGNGLLTQAKTHKETHDKVILLTNNYP